MIIPGITAYQATAELASAVFGAGKTFSIIFFKYPLIGLRKKIEFTTRLNLLTFSETLSL
jgi:hypothetical protein